MFSLPPDSELSLIWSTCSSHSALYKFVAISQHTHVQLLFNHAMCYIWTCCTMHKSHATYTHKSHSKNVRRKRVPFRTWTAHVSNGRSTCSRVTYARVTRTTIFAHYCTGIPLIGRSLCREWCRSSWKTGKPFLVNMGNESTLQLESLSASTSGGIEPGILLASA